MIGITEIKERAETDVLIDYNGRSYCVNLAILCMDLNPLHKPNIPEDILSRVESICVREQYRDETPKEIKPEQFFGDGYRLLVHLLEEGYFDKYRN